MAKVTIEFNISSDVAPNMSRFLSVNNIEFDTDVDGKNICYTALVDEEQVARIKRRQTLLSGSAATQNFIASAGETAIDVADVAIQSVVVPVGKLGLALTAKGTSRVLKGIVQLGAAAFNIATENVTGTYKEIKGDKTVSQATDTLKGLFGSKQTESSDNFKVRKAAV